MESLRPDRDELDRFKTRSSKPAAGSAKKTVSTGGGGTHWFLVLLVVLLVASNGFLLWQNHQSDAKIVEMSKSLEEAQSFIGRSKLVIARLEGDLNQAGQELMHTGTQVDSELAKHWFEINKLWNLSNKRNKPAIQENEKLIKENNAAIKKQSTIIQKNKDEVNRVAKRLATVEISDKARAEELTALSRSVDSSLESTNKLRQAIDGRKDEISSRLKSVENSVAVSSLEVISTNELVKEEVAAIKALINAQDKRLEELDKHQAAIDAINQTRSVVNERLIGLEQRLAKVQRDLASGQKSTSGVDGADTGVRLTPDVP